MTAYLCYEELYWFAGYTSSAVKDYSGFCPVSLVIFPAVNTNYFVAPFTNLDLINFMLSRFFSSHLPMNLLKYLIY